MEDSVRAESQPVDCRPRARRWLWLVLMLAWPCAAMRGQLASAPAQVGLQSLHIDILEGEGALNNIRQRDAREPVVQVTDENHKPVAGAVVLFEIHGGASGAGATFAGQATTLSVTTGADGIARTAGLTVTKSPGSYTISVTASLGSLVASVVVHQSNIIGPLNSSSTNANVTGAVARHTILGLSKTVVLVVGSVAVAGVVVGVVQATKTPATTVSLGTSSIGP